MRRERVVRFSEGDDEVHELRAHKLDNDDGLAGRAPWYMQEDDGVDFDDGADEEEEMRTGQSFTQVQGEEEGDERYNDAGERLEPFNLRSERANDGFFDDAGNFVWRKNAREPDAWVAGMTEDEAVEEAAIGLATARRSREIQNYVDTEMKEKLDLRKLLILMQRAETLAQCLRRLGKALPSSRQDFDTVTAIGDALLASGRFGAFDQVREDLLPKDPRQWEYTADDGKVYGPFDTLTILDWRDQGYFRHATPMRLVQSPKPVVHSVQGHSVHDFSVDFEDEDTDQPPSKKFKAHVNDWTPADAIDFTSFGWTRDDSLEVIMHEEQQPTSEYSLKTKSIMDNEDNDDDWGCADNTTIDNELSTTRRHRNRLAFEQERDDDND
mmetsp:Transcript_16199/g.21185  ORF Transcript_16199/g.21185 Transcript_16199/m.21185 type:complete len:382 (+) Transcript_16199:218-1363(+)|eukprot:CAMPEP_0197301622 /NCGR_PEP_ID=MMETSP0890-20130614/50516_1 /TAXON_ID=44058 ORGANISM="Aureoumbra lagunensis, Strain CCMP1510" /NCGR_SAMPLE_ID=MMETSP0890 /ASSEMBLY_ACC=CAM_ASM_000533 /LENGTH=381 /DNA_ID=CAMNT_0042780973 /DNA_START=158 /DNA_END=1303 /DNA_ORIENTATION=+